MSARSRDFAQVDVFSATACRGNPVAVILDAEGLDDEAMQLFARWTNLSETTFVLPASSSEADYRLRIFTPGGEVPFAGHPTLGSVHAWLEHGGVPRTVGRIIQECGAGPVEIRHHGSTLAFAAPPTRRSGPIEEEYLARIVAALGIDRGEVIAHQWADNGPGWVVIRLRAAGDVVRLHPDFAGIPEAELGVIGAYPEGSPHAFEMRAFAPGVGVLEDPVTGSLAAAVGQWLARTGAAPASYRISQGGCLGRAGEIAISTGADGTTWVGGAATTLLRGTALI
jgi:PhzF family phenazine biosynthesis protein